MPQYLPIGRAAKYLGKSVDTLRRWEEQGKILSKRSGGRRRYFLIADLEKLKYGDLLTVKEASTRLAITPSTLRRLADEGTIKSTRSPNGYRKFAVEEIERYLAAEEHLLDKARADDIVHRKSAKEPDTIEPRAKGLYPSLRTHLVKVSESLGKTRFLGKISFAAITTIILAIVITFTVLAAAFTCAPHQTAQFFGFGIKSGGERYSDYSAGFVLGASDAIEEASQGRVLGIVAAVFEGPAKTTAKVLGILAPESVEDIIIEGIGIEGPVGPPGPQGPVGASGLDGIDAVGAVTLESIGSLSFLRSDTSDAYTSGTLTFNDSTLLALGTGTDFTLTHDGDDTILTSKTGDLLIDNTNSKGSILIQLGTDTDATDFRIRDDDKDNLFRVWGDGDANLSGALSVEDLTVRSGESIILAGAHFKNEGYYTSVDTNWIVENEDGTTSFLGVYLTDDDSHGEASLIAQNYDGYSIDIIKYALDHPDGLANDGLIVNDGGDLGIFTDHDTVFSIGHFDDLVKDEYGEILNFEGKEDILTLTETTLTLRDVNVFSLAGVSLESYSIPYGPITFTGLKVDDDFSVNTSDDGTVLLSVINNDTSPDSSAVIAASNFDQNALNLFKFNANHAISELGAMVNANGKLKILGWENANDANSGIQFGFVDGFVLDSELEVMGFTNETNVMTIFDDAVTVYTDFNIDSGTLNINDSGTLAIDDDIDLTFGTDLDWAIQYDEGVDDQLLFATTNTAAGALTDPLVEFLVGTTPTADQQIFGIAKGTQASNTALLTLDEDGDMEIPGTFTTQDLVVTSGSSITLEGATFENQGYYTSIDTNWTVTNANQATAFLGIYSTYPSDVAYANLVLQNKDGNVLNLVKNSATNPFSPNAGGLTNDGDFGTFIGTGKHMTFQHFDSLTKDSYGNITNLSGLTERMRIHDDGNVGIGDSSPGTLLQMAGADAYLTLQNTTDEYTDGGAETRIIFEDHSNTALAQIEGSHFDTGDNTWGGLTFSTNNGSGLVTAMHIDREGQITIGDTYFDTSYQLVINETSDVLAGMRIVNSSSETNATAAMLATSPGSTVGLWSYGPSHSTYPDQALFSASGNSGGLLIETDAYMAFLTGGSNERMRIDSSGNVGIGTTDPDRKLDILDTSNPQLRLTYTDSSVYADFQVDSGGNLIIDNVNTAGATKFQLGTDTAATDFQVLNNTGTTLFEVDGAGGVSAGSRSIIEPETPTPYGVDNTNLVEYLSCNGNVKDYSGYGKDGTLTGDTTYSDGVFGKGVELDGSGDYITLPATAIPRGQGTISHWIKTDSNTTQQMIAYIYGGSGTFDGFGHGGTDQLEMHTSINNDGTAGFLYQDGTTNNNIGGGSISTTGWHHMVATYDTTGYLRLYLDGTEVANLDVSAQSFTNNTPTGSLIGGGPGSGTRQFDGEIDEIMFFDRVLSASEVSSLYSAGNKFKTSSTSLVYSGNVKLSADSTTLSFGADADFTISHGGTNTVFDNTFATGATQFQLGTDTSATDFQVLNNTGTTLFEVDGVGNATLGNVLASWGGILRVNSDSNGIALLIEESGDQEAWGIGVDADGDLKFFDSGTGAYKVTFEDGTGRVGIGDATPDYLLDVAGTLGVDGDATFNALSASSGVYTNASKALTSTPPTSGTVGYWGRTGTTLSPATAGDNLTISGNTVLGDGDDTITLNPTSGTNFSNTDLDSVRGISLDWLVSNDATIVLGYGDENSYTQTAGSTHAFTLGSNAGDDFIVDTTTLVVEGDNNRVGIGTISPGAGLTVTNGRIQVTSDTAATSGDGLELGADSNEGLILSYDRDNTHYKNLRFNALNYTWDTSGSSRMTLDASGNVGIGDTSPDQLLEILSSGAANTQLSIGNTNAGDYDAQIGFELVDGTNSFTMGIDDSDGDKFKISTTGLGTSDRLVLTSDETILRSETGSDRIELDTNTFMYHDGTRDRLYIGDGWTDLKSESGEATFTLDGVNTIITDGSIDRLEFYNDRSKIISPDGNKNLLINNTGSTFTGGTFTFNDGTRDRLAIDASNSKMYSPNGTQHVGVNDTTVDIWNGTANVFQSSAFSTVLTSPDGTLQFQTNNSELVLADSSRSRLKVDSTDTRMVSPDGTDYLVLTNTGVGIGTTDPDNTLTVSGDANIANGYGLIIGNASQATIAGTAPEFQVLGTSSADSSMLIGSWQANSSGPLLNFGKSRNATIGSSTIVQDNDVLGGLVFYPDEGGVGFSTPSARFTAEVDDTTPLAYEIGTAFVWEQSTLASGSITETMRLSSDGYLGIGDTSPDDLLNIHSASASAGLAITSLGTDTDPYLGFQLADGTNTFTMGIDDSDSDKFKISTTGLGTNDRLVIDSSGNVGIGTAGPSTKLHVKGATATDAILFIEPGEWNSSGDYGEIRFGDTSHYIRGEHSVGTTFYDSNRFYFQGTSNVQVSNWSNGTVVSDASGNLSVSSDERLKNIAGSFDKGLEAIRGLEPISYQWNELSGMETEGVYSGFGAQNVQDFIPEAVGEGRDGYLTLSDRPILAATVNAVKELDDKMEGQILVLSEVNGGLVVETENNTTALEFKLSSLEDRVAALEASQSAVLGEQTTTSEAPPISDSPQFEEVAEEVTEELIDQADLGIFAETNYRIWSLAEGFVFKAKVRFENVIEFASNVIFRGPITVNTDTAGSITIPAGETRVKATFNTPFEKIPSVNLTPAQKIEVNYTLEEVTEDSFVVDISEALEVDIVFNWIALVVEGDPIRVEIVEVETLESSESIKDSSDVVVDATETTKVETPPMMEDVMETSSSETSENDTIKTEEVPEEKHPKIIIIENPLGFVRIREEASIDSEEIATAPSLENYPYDEILYDWYHIEYQPGSWGWVSGTYVQELP